MSRRKPWGENTFQKLPLESLSIEALNRVLDMRSAYDLEFQRYQARRAPIEAENKSLRTAISSAKQQMNDLDSQAQQAHAQLAQFEVGMVGAIGKWLFSEPTIERSGRYYKTEAQPIIARWNLLWKRRNEINDLQQSSARKLENVERQREYEPKKEAKLRHQSQTFVFDISVIDRDRVERIIEKKSNKVELESERAKNRRQRVQTKLEQHKAKAAAYENKQRELAKSVRTPTALRMQLKDYPNCPYCNKELSTKDAHADHIHPVVNGGLSTIGNMVFVCGSCNVAKGTLTLRAFLKKMDYADEDVYERLERMRKVV